MDRRDVGSARIVRGNALALPLADESVDLVVTSPPYFGLRSYQDGGEHYDGQIGAEATPAEFVDALIAATREMVRVLKPSGSIWVNLGDKYAGGGGFAPDAPSNVARRNGETGSTFRGATTEHARQGSAGSGGKTYGLRAKSLIGVPWRYALRCIDDLGLILRAEVIWSKPNGLPESVTDRVRRSHETWFHFTRSPRYYSAVDEIREEQSSIGRKQGGPNGRDHRKADLARDNANVQLLSTLDTLRLNPLGKIPGSVWSIPTQPLKVPAELGIDHFAAFPMEWPRRIIQGWSPAGVCVECGEGRRPVVAKSGYRVVNGAYKAAAITAAYDTGRGNTHGRDGSTLGRERDTIITGCACACPEPTADTTPGVVLDPFGGTGTTALVAKAYGRDGISVDMSADYCRLATWRTNDPGQIAKAMQVKPPKAKKPAPQVDLFEDELSA